MNDLNDIDALILCGGLGKRLRSVDDQTPKVMMPVEGRPFLDLIIDHLKAGGIERVVLCTGYKAHIVEDYYRRNDRGIVIDFSREEELLGTGGAVKSAREIVRTNPFIVLNGDSLCPIDLKGLVDFHQRCQGVATLGISKVPENKDYGGISIDEDSRIIAFDEKTEARSSYVNTGVYCFDRRIFELMPERDNFMFEYDVFPQLIGRGIYGYKTQQGFHDIGTPDRYKQARDKGGW